MRFCEWRLSEAVRCKVRSETVSLAEPVFGNVCEGVGGGVTVTVCVSLTDNECDLLSTEMEACGETVVEVDTRSVWVGCGDTVGGGVMVAVTVSVAFGVKLAACVADGVASAVRDGVGGGVMVADPVSISGSDGVMLTLSLGVAVTEATSDSVAVFRDFVKSADADAVSSSVGDCDGTVVGVGGSCGVSVTVPLIVSRADGVGRCVSVMFPSVPVTFGRRLSLAVAVALALVVRESTLDAVGSTVLENVGTSDRDAVRPFIEKVGSSDWVRLPLSDGSTESEMVSVSMCTVGVGAGRTLVVACTDSDDETDSERVWDLTVKVCFDGCSVDELG